jgi:GNAT superfamily N-acetyltransferase
MRLSSMAEIRPFREPDAPAAAELLRGLLPGYLFSPELLLHWNRSAPPRAHACFWVAESGQRIVGWADAEFRWRAAEPGIGELWVGVAGDARRRGFGGRLYDIGEKHLLDRGAWKLESGVDDESGRIFAERRGFRPTRVERLWTLDPAAVDPAELTVLEAAKRAEGFTVLPLRELLGRPRDLHALYAEADADIPSDDEPGEFPYEEWLEETLRTPLLDRDGSFTVLFGNRPVSFAWLLVDREGGRAEHELTGTLREFRGQGLARLAKLAGIRWARENGIRTLLTGNDSANAPMLRINERLGYRPTIERTEVAKLVGTRRQLS